MSFESLLINKLKIVEITPGDWGETTETTGGPIPCRIVYKTRLMRDWKGEESLSAAQIFIKPEHLTFDHNAKIKLDTDNYDRSHPIITIKRSQDSKKTHHGEIWIT